MGKTIRMSELSEQRRQVLRSRIISIMNNKGGCAKTTSATALGMYLARTGNNVLFWDNDSQCNLTQRLGLPDGEQTDRRLDTLFRDADKNPDISLIAEYHYLQKIHGSKEETGRIGLMPGSHMSESYASDLADKYQKFGRELKDRTQCNSIYDFFGRTMEFYKKYFDYIIIDTAPALEGNILNKLALMISDEIIIPIDSYEAALGIRQLLNWMEGQISPLDHKPNGLFIMTKYQLDTKGVRDYSIDKLSRNIIFSDMKKVFGDFVCNTGIQELRSLRLSAKGVPGFGGKTKYTELCKEIVEKISSERKNLFDFYASTDAINDLELLLAVIEQNIRKRKPKFKVPKYGVINEE